MKLTNKNNLPDMMLTALQRDDHVMGNSQFSVTQLGKSVRQLQLAKRHADKVVRDAVDMWNVFIGTCVHGGIYNSVKDNADYLLEKRFEIQVGDITIGGTPDAYQHSTKTLFDHKTMQTSAHGLEVKDGYEEQLNVYAYILEKNGYPVDKIMLNVIYLDWRVLAAKLAEPGKYPPAPVQLVEIKKWSKDSVEAYIEARVALHKAAELLEDDELPECTAEECWEKPAKIAIYSFKGALKASKLCNNWKEVDEWISWKGKKKDSLHISVRPASRRRCQMYCDAAPFCNQYQNWLKDQDNQLNVEDTTNVESV